MKALSSIAALCVPLALAASGQSDSDSIERYRDELKGNPGDSLAHFELGEIYFRQRNFQTAANEYREALNGNLRPSWVEVRSHVGLAKIFELTGQHDRAVNEYKLAGYGWPAAIFPAAFSLRLTPLGPQPIHETEPEYSQEARAAGLEGTVFVRVSIAPDGTPSDPSVESPLGLGLDEKAVEAVSKWRFPSVPPGAPAASALVPVDFLLPSKLSRWHLVSASFQTPAGAARPVFLTEPYPLGAGISVKAIEEGSVIAAIRRSATVTLQLDVDEHGIPANFKVLAASYELWGPEAIAVVRKWRFTPGVKDGKPMSVPCTLELIWGQKVWTPASLAEMRAAINAALGLDQTDAADLRAAQGLLPKIRSIYPIDDSTPHNPYSVIVSVIIQEDGTPIIEQVIRHIASDYDRAAIDAVRRSRFDPPLLNGTPVPLSALIEVDF